MRPLHKILLQPSDKIKLILARWHVADSIEPKRRFGYTKWEDGKIWYRHAPYQDWVLVDINAEDGIGSDFEFCFETRPNVSIKQFQPDMLSML